MPKAPASIVYRDEQEFEDWIATESGFLEAFGQYADEDLLLDPFQREFLEFRKADGERPRFRHISKSRRIGFSFMCSLEGVARCHLRERHQAIYVSYNLADAKEIIQQARAVHEGLPLRYQKRLAVDTKTELAFEPRAGGRRHQSRMISLPAKPPRGKDGDCYLDEFAHCPGDDDIFNGATALIARSGGQLTICSTPLGKRGKFWEIAAREGGRHHKFARFRYPWWACTKFCHDIPRACIEAPAMPTQDRVARFGTEAIQDQLEALGEEAFQQEFECAFIDESTAFMPYDLILSCMLDEPEPGEKAGRGHIVVTDEPELVPAPTGRLVAGVDIGRTRDFTSISVFEEVGGHYYTRLRHEMARAQFRTQHDYLRRMLKVLPLARLSIDRHGIGAQIAEDLEREFPLVVRQETFTVATKERWAIRLKTLMQERRITLPRRRLLLAQLHAVRKKVTASGNVIYDAVRSNGDGHADGFWSVALACQEETAATTAGRVRIRVIG